MDALPIVVSIVTLALFSLAAVLPAPPSASARTRTAAA